MSPVIAVLLIFVVTFLIGSVGSLVLPPGEEGREPISPMGWLVRGLVGLAVAHTSVGIFDTIEEMRSFGGSDYTARAATMSRSVMDLIVFGGILLGLAALLHVLDRRRAAERE